MIRSVTVWFDISLLKNISRAHKLLSQFQNHRWKLLLFFLATDHSDQKIEMVYLRC